MVLNWAPGRVLKLSSSGIEQYQIRSLLIMIMIMSFLLTMIKINMLIIMVVIIIYLRNTVR